MTVELPPDLEAFINRELVTGAYPTREALIRDAVLLLRQARDQQRSLRADIRHAEAQLDEGQAEELDVDDVVARGHGRLRSKGIGGECRP